MMHWAGSEQKRAVIKEKKQQRSPHDAFRVYVLPYRMPGNPTSTALSADPPPPDLRHAGDGRVQLCLPRDLRHVLGRGGQVAIRDVVADRVVEEHRVLRNHPHRSTEARLRHPLDVLAGDLNAARTYTGRTRCSFFFVSGRGKGEA